MDGVGSAWRGPHCRRVSTCRPFHNHILLSSCDSLADPTLPPPIPTRLPRSTIAFTLNLHTSHSTTLSQAYQIATSQFIKLRAINEIANYAAEEEALAYSTDGTGRSGSKSTKSGKEGSSRKAFVRTPLLFLR